MHSTFFFTDIHGNYNIYSAIIQFCLSRDQECTIIYGGDACDRGVAGYQIMKEMLANPQIVYLKGNHEDMFVNTVHELQQNSIQPTKQNIEEFLRLNFYSETYLHYINGGSVTILDWIKDECNEEIIDALESLPLTYSLDTLDFCHAGGLYKTFKRVANAQYNNEPISNPDKKSLLWDRDLLSWGWGKDRICVFGHTPVRFLPLKILAQSSIEASDDVYPRKWYGLVDRDTYPGVKIDMDTCTYDSKIAYVLDCNTMITYGFKEENNTVQQFNIMKI